MRLYNQCTRLFIIAAIWLAGATPYSFGANYTVTVDANTTWGPLPHFWSRCAAVGRLGLVKSDTLQRHLKDAVDNLGTTMVRFHAGLSDALVYSESGGVPAYSWGRCDSLYDILVRQVKIKPFLELNWMPSDLANTTLPCPATSVRPSTGSYCPPKDYERWRTLIYEFVKHLETRYGAEEVRSWRFETWNEAEWFGHYGNPTSPSSPSLPMTENWKMQAYSTLGALAADSGIKIGGPASSGYDWEVKLSKPFLEYCGTQNVHVDFLSYHAYHELWKTVDGHFFALKTMDTCNAKYPNLRCFESSNTEYGPTYQFNLDPEPAETGHGAVFIADVASQIALRCHSSNVKFPYVYVWWVLSDIFDEGTYRTQYPFTGCMGIISRQDIRKPAYNTFKMMQMLGNVFTAITFSPSGTVTGLAAQDSTKGVQVLVCNPDYTTSTASDNITVTVNGISSSTGVVRYRRYLLDRTHSNSYETWVAMGKPSIASMSAAQWTSLRSSMALATVDSSDTSRLSGGTFTRSYSLEKKGVMLIRLNPVEPVNVLSEKPFRTAEETLSFSAWNAGRGLVISLPFNGPGQPPQTTLFDCRGRTAACFEPVRKYNGTCEIIIDGRFRPGVYFLKYGSGATEKIHKFAFR